MDELHCIRGPVFVWDNSQTSRRSKNSLLPWHLHNRNLAEYLLADRALNSCNLKRRHTTVTCDGRITQKESNMELCDLYLAFLLLSESEPMKREATAACSLLAVE
ncbi:hypothetical protein GW17_00056274, partial [Ensete ventricosum]